MSLHIPDETYEDLFRISDQIPGVFAWTTSGGCHYGRGCTYCDVSTQDFCNKRIPHLLAKYNLSPTQALLCTNNEFTVVQLEDYPEYFV